MEDNAMKKEYMKPAMQVVEIRQQHIICASHGAKSFGDSSEEFIFDPDGLGDVDV